MRKQAEDINNDIYSQVPSMLKTERWANKNQGRRSGGEQGATGPGPAKMPKYGAEGKLMSTSPHPKFKEQLRHCIFVVVAAFVVSNLGSKDPGVKRFKS